MPTKGSRIVSSSTIKGSYDDLKIGDGVAAANAWLNMRTIDDDLEFENVKKNLLGYCRMDMLAMVMILERMRQMV